MSSSSYVKDDVKFSGKYSRSIFHSVSMSIDPFKKKFIFSIAIGFFGRLLLLLNANIIGSWVDNICVGANLCKYNSNIFSHLTSNDFINLLLIFTTIGFILSAIFRMSAARMGTFSSSIFYDETTLRVSRFPLTFFDTNPVGRIITRFSSDYSAVNRMSGSPLTEAISISFDLVIFFVLTIIASIYFLPFLIVSILINYLVYKLNKDNLRKERRELSRSRAPAISHFAETLPETNVKPRLLKSGI